MRHGIAPVISGPLMTLALAIGIQTSLDAQSNESNVPPRPESGTPTFKTEAREVSVVFRVVDKKNQLVPGITPSEIHVDDEGISRPITSFSGDVANAQVVVVADVSGSMGAILEPLQGALFTFADLLAQDRDREPGDVLLSLVPFSDRATLLVDRTPNPEEFKSAVKKLRPTGVTALVDTVLATLLNAFGDKEVRIPAKASKSAAQDDMTPIPSEFRRRRPTGHVAGTRRSKFLVLLTDAGENASSHQWFDITAAMLGKDVVIYSIAFDSGTPDANVSMLSKVTVQSGGKVYKAKVDNLQKVYTQIASDIRSHYQLTFAATDVVNSRKWRRIAVTTGRPDVTISGRMGYCPETPCQKEDGTFVGGSPKNWNDVVALSRDPAVIYSMKQHLENVRFEYNPETEKIVSSLASGPLLIERAWNANGKRGSDRDKPFFVTHRAEDRKQSVNIDAEVCGVRLDPELSPSSRSLFSSASEPALRVIDPEIRLARRPGSAHLAPSAVAQDTYFQSQALFFLKDPSGRIPSRIRVQCNRPHFLIGDDLVQFAIQALEYGLKVNAQ
ncbi:MAG TPA: VWA domain-containing protein [Bryobacteraceae bacterium]